MTTINHNHNIEVNMSFTLSNLKRKKKSELFKICSSRGIEVDKSDTNAIIAMKIMQSSEAVTQPTQGKVTEAKLEEIAQTLGVENGLGDIQGEIKKAVKKMRKQKLTVVPTRDDSKDTKAAEAKAKAKEEKQKQKASKSSKAKAKKQAANLFIKMVVEAMLEDARTGKNGIVCEGNKFLVPASLFGPNKPYKIVKTYSVSRQAWQGNGRRDKKTGYWTGHRHPAPRILLELGYESQLKKQNGEWVLHVQPVDEFATSFLQ